MHEFLNVQCHQFLVSDCARNDKERTRDLDWLAVCFVSLLAFVLVCSSLNQFEFSIFYVAVHVQLLDDVHCISIITIFYQICKPIPFELPINFQRKIIKALVGNAPDLSRTGPIPWNWPWTGLFWGRGVVVTGLLSPMSWACPHF